jgi:DNA-binding NarL/FixJ family response regulator
MKLTIKQMVEMTGLVRNTVADYVKQLNFPRSVSSEELAYVYEVGDPRSLKSRLEAVKKRNLSKPRKKKRKPKIWEKQEEICQAYLDGKSMKNIAAEFDTSLYLVRQMLRNRKLR